MLVLDFINVGNGDSTLVREMENGEQKFAMLVDCGHDSLVRDDHPQELDPRSRRIYAGDFLKKQGVARLDKVLLTHFHRDHIGGLGRVLEAAEAERFLAAYIPPEGNGPLDPDGDNGLPGAARNLLRCLDIYASACGHLSVMPKTDTAKLLVDQTASQLRAASAALAALRNEMQSLAASLPEYPVVMGMFGVGPVLGPQLMAEIGDVRRFHSKKALVAYAGIDSPPNDSGQVIGNHKKMSKVGSSALRGCEK